MCHPASVDLPECPSRPELRFCESNQIKRQPLSALQILAYCSKNRGSNKLNKLMIQDQREVT
jgi:hypothetical protein